MLFKYLPPERVDVLANLRIRFTQLSSLNDPFEAQKLVSANAAKAGLFKDFERNAAEFEACHPEMTSEQREEFARVKRDLLLNMENHFSPWAFGEEMMKLVNPAIGVLSLSRENDVALMWSHYAASYAGFVIGFDDRHPFFSMPTADGRPSSPKEVKYSHRRITVDADSPDYYDLLFCQKPAYWAYEREVRCFRAFSDFEHAGKPDDRGNTVFLSDFPAEMVSGIYVGFQTSDETREVVKRFTSTHPHPCPILEARPSSDGYGVDFRPPLR